MAGTFGQQQRGHEEHSGDHVARQPGDDRRLGSFMSGHALGDLCRCVEDRRLSEHRDVEQEERRERRDEGERQHRGQLGARRGFVDGRRPSPARPERSGQHQRSADGQDEVRRTQQGLDPYFDAKGDVPQHVTQSPDPEHDHAQDCEAVPTRGQTEVNRPPGDRRLRHPSRAIQAAVAPNPL